MHSQGTAKKAKQYYPHLLFHPLHIQAIVANLTSFVFNVSDLRADIGRVCATYICNTSIHIYYIYVYSYIKNKIPECVALAPMVISFFRCCMQFCFFFVAPSFHYEKLHLNL